MSLKTESQVIEEGRQGFVRNEENPYLLGTWAYKAWQSGYSAASKKSGKMSDNKIPQEG